MPRYDHPSKYFADDKDIADLLDSHRFSHKKLLQLAMERGILLSHDLPTETLRDQLSRIPFSWLQFQNLLNVIETPDTEEKVTTCRYESSASLDVVQKVLSDIRDIRGDTANEAYIIRTVGEGISVRVSYSEIDHQSTRVLQRIHKEMEIFLGPTTGGYEFRFPANQRAEAIIEKITDMLPVPDGTEKPKRQTVGLAGVVDAAMRTEFFLLLMDGMDQFKRRDVIDLKMNRILADEVISEEEEDDESERAEEEMKGLVKRMSLAGEALLSSPQFRQLAQDGFYISRTIWETKETTGKGRVFELEAQFKDAEGGTGFCYLVRGVHNYGDDGELEVTKKHIQIDDRKLLNKTIEEAAYRAVATIQSKLQTAPSKDEPPQLASE